MIYDISTKFPSRISESIMPPKKAPSKNPKVDETDALKRKGGPEDLAATVENFDAGSKGGKKAKQKNFSKLGRRGDPRMHKSVAARLANPELTLLDALQIGGFVFPSLANIDPKDKSKIDDSTIHDTENVTLSQRKNQLSRRLRIARQKGSNDATSEELGNADNAGKGKRKGKGKAKTGATSMAEANSMLTPEARRQMQALMKENPQALRNLQSNNAGIPDVSSLAAEHYRQMLSLAGHPIAIAGLADSAPEIVTEDANDDSDVAQVKKSKRAKDHPLFSQYQNTVLNNSAHWGGIHNVMTSVAASQAVAATNASLAALGASNGSKAAASSSAGGSSGTNPLAVTAASLGMSKEQLALMMGQGGVVEKKAGGDKGDLADLAEDQDAIEENKLRVALNVYQTEHSTLLKRCLLIAGVEMSKTEECDPLYIKFVEKASQAEQKRLHRLTACFSGRHVHRLDGKCGHRAILHHPTGDDKPHVDFIVDGKVECYKGLSGIKHVGNGEAMWPSKFSCDDLEVHKHDDITCGDHKCASLKQCSTATKHIHPTTLDMDLQDMEGNSEWMELNDGNFTDSMLGLVTLTDDKEKSDSMEI